MIRYFQNIVRIHGTFVNFLDLSPAIQQDIIRRLDPGSTSLCGGKEHESNEKLTGEGSWQMLLEEYGFDVRVRMQGLGVHAAVQKRFVEKAAQDIVGCA